MTDETIDDAPQLDELLRVWYESGNVADRGVVIRAAGEIDLVSAWKLREALDRVEVRPVSAGPVVVDLTEVTFLGSVGLSLLVEHSQRHRDAGGVLWVVTGNRFVARAIAMTGLSDTLTVYDTLDDAMKVTS
ncbi:MAG: STAS domain-containing protein [Actinophytocola sp.]|uniref:STAS domain-containing protein n=1 Tax=Actinophytocola sp. TaxID=1872138 RepID=UPI003C785DD9